MAVVIQVDLDARAAEWRHTDVVPSMLSNLALALRLSSTSHKVADTGVKPVFLMRTT